MTCRQPVKRRPESLCCRLLDLACPTSFWLFQYVLWNVPWDSHETISIQRQCGWEQRLSSDKKCTCRFRCTCRFKHWGNSATCLGPQGTEGLVPRCWSVMSQSWACDFTAAAAATCRLTHQTVSILKTHSRYPVDCGSKLKMGCRCTGRHMQRTQKDWCFSLVGLVDGYLDAVQTGSTCAAM